MCFEIYQAKRERGMNLFTQDGQQRIRKHLSEYEIHFHESVDSTQSECLRLFQKDKKKAKLVLADSQTAGHGRYGRSWASPRGVNLYFSFLTENPWGHQIGYLNLMYGVLLWEAVSFLYSPLPGLTLKWPNDLYYGEKKLAGILFQTLDNEFRPMIVGVGINVYARQDEIPETATSLLLEKGQNIGNQARICVLESFFSTLNKSMQEYLQKPSLILTRFWHCSQRTQHQSYLYSSSQYRWKGKLAHLHPDGTVDILTEEGELIHLVS